MNQVGGWVGAKGACTAIATEQKIGILPKNWCKGRFEIIGLVPSKWRFCFFFDWSERHLLHLLHLLPLQYRLLLLVEHKTQPLLEVQVADLYIAVQLSHVGFNS